MYTYRYASASPDVAFGYRNMKNSSFYTLRLIGVHDLAYPIDEVVHSRESARQFRTRAVAAAERNHSDDVPRAVGASTHEWAAAISGAAADAAVAETVVRKPIDAQQTLTSFESPDRRGALLHFLRHFSVFIFSPSSYDAIGCSFVIRVRLRQTDFSSLGRRFQFNQSDVETASRFVFRMDE